jgi:hypothetical protein
MFHQSVGAISVSASLAHEGECAAALLLADSDNSEEDNQWQEN